MKGSPPAPRPKGLVHLIERVLPLCLLALWGVSYVVVRCVDHYVCALAWYWQVLLVAGGPLIFAVALVVLCSPLYLLLWLVLRAEDRSETVDRRL